MSQAGTISSTSNPQIATTYVTDSGNAIPAANILNVLGGVGANTTGSGNTITINVDSPSYTWNVVTSANNPVSLTAQNAYIAKGGTAVNFVLPATASIGDTFRIVGNANLWTLSQNASQSISVGVNTTTVGVGGSLTATKVSDNLEFVCVTTNTQFTSLTVQGNLTVV